MPRDGQHRSSVLSPFCLFFFSLLLPILFVHFTPGADTSAALSLRSPFLFFLFDSHRRKRTARHLLATGHRWKRVFIWTWQGGSFVFRRYQRLQTKLIAVRHTGYLIYFFALLLLSIPCSARVHHRCEAPCFLSSSCCNWANGRND